MGVSPGRGKDFGVKLQRWQWILLWVLMLAGGAALLVWSLRSVPLADIAGIFSKLGLWQIGVLLLVNTGIVILFPLRWWLIVRAQGYRVPYLAMARYRLVGFAISYFTPGQHFGGEPAQVLYLRNQHKMPGAAALASVTLDRVIELVTNFAVLALGVAVLLASGVLTDLPLGQTLPLSLSLLLIPAGYLATVWYGARPLKRFTQRITHRLVEGIRNSEEQLGRLAKEQPQLLLQGFLIALLVWAALIFEIWVCLVYLGLQTSLLDLILVVVAARVALFVPTPGALGALEASQVLAMQTLGYPEAYGLSLGLLIRGRDVFFGLAGLLLGALKRG
jgi:uncharacterized protein (TIRG00374 family)